MSRPRRTAFYLTGLVLAAVLAAVFVVAAARHPADEFVTRDGSAFRIGDESFRFVGFNVYDAAATDIYSCRPQTRMDEQRLREILTYARDRAGASVIRFWAFQTYTAGGTDFTGVDRVIRIARDLGLRVIPVLEDGPGHCSTGGPADAAKPLMTVAGDSWYTQGYRVPYGSARLSFRDYARVMAAHYRDEPTIMAWMMVNEAETAARTADGRTALAPFARDVASVIRQADPRHLITLGTQGNGAPGSAGPDFRVIYQESGLDFAEVHDWGFYGDDSQALPGAAGGRLPSPTSPECSADRAPIACSFSIAHQLGKPLVVGEAGITALDATARDRRSTLLGAKIRAAFDLGAQGYLVWQLNIADTDGYGVVPDDHDPLVKTLQQEAEQLTN